MTSWIDEYLAAYFVPTARAVLDPLLAAHGLRWAGDRRQVSAYWCGSRRFLSVGYLPETAPDYELLLAAGESDRSPLESPETSVGVWRLVPPAEVDRIATWTFDGPQALERELLRAWREAIEPYVLPVWEEHGRLTRIAAAHEAELDEEDARAEREELLERARGAFRAGRFDEALTAYDAVGDDALMPSDRKRVEIARARRTGADDPVP